MKEEIKELPPLLTVKEAARYLKTTETTIWRWVKVGKLSSVKIGRLRRILLESLLKLVQSSQPADTLIAKRSSAILRMDQLRLQLPSMDTPVSELIESARSERDKQLWNPKN